ncbi:MAG: hypothetical protein A2087_02255 [Spirochaetes bacterium GWD1_61_31]|nr:MAG: hypothetical protein A2Y37_00675 [Spirochaetes bacterium GWB1_60_80]OHD29473.1 MAG: hypothetical protein A2004_03720 [Spirochaetes bacterium GWC1_61_12]OHD43993.1 MAG: hypothetical protein A2087_02255 [Spirochaetes bacterium GWD1_61_31]OHD46195.1 MAG: hypothetical protein A2Y35_00850 [Spirochaetes bacterium GWE1_60_18]OHD60733.1 MAG: hypothetical protein A2Y32_07655 [Spirochaetes bacterium GWF1_60_12]HAP43875.1 hypothetical protein [Spirochaetaceae bacterium]
MILQPLQIILDDRATATGGPGDERTLAVGCCSLMRVIFRISFMLFFGRDMVALLRREDTSQVADLNRNHWQIMSGIQRLARKIPAVSCQGFRSEVAVYHRNLHLLGWQETAGIGGRFGPDYPS